MVPAGFVTFFSVMAGVGATLFGLVFVALSITPEVARAENLSVMRQVLIASAYSALLNPLVISLLALTPQATIGTVTVIMSTIGLVNTLVMGSFLFRDARSTTKRLRSGLFILGSLVIFGVEFYFAVRLATVPADRAALSDLTTLLVIIYLYGIARAWDLVGARQFHLQEVLTPLVPNRLTAMLSDTPSTERSTDDSNQRD